MICAALLIFAATNEVEKINMGTIQSPKPTTAQRSPLPRNNAGQEAFANYYEARSTRAEYESRGNVDAETLARLHQLEAEASAALELVADYNAPPSGMTQEQL